MKAELDLPKLVRGITLHVEVKGVRRWLCRLRFALWLFRLAAWVSGMGIEIAEIDDLRETFPDQTPKPKGKD